MPGVPQKQFTTQRSVVSIREEPPESEVAPNVHWTDASSKSLMLNGIKVHVESVEWDAVRDRDVGVIPRRHRKDAPQRDVLFQVAEENVVEFRSPFVTLKE